MHYTHFKSGALPCILSALFLLGGLAYTDGSQAQNLYRCGSTYQDKPCDNGQGQLIKKNPLPSTSDKPPLDANCIRRGEEAKKIIWMREGGAFQDRLQSEAKTNEQRKLIADVYALRGNANDIRAKIESDCMADKEVERKTGMRPVDDEVKRHQDAERKASGENPKDTPKDSKQADSSEAERKKKLCEDIRRQIAAASNSQRAGGSAKDMETMASNKKEIENNLKELGCGR